MRLLRSALGLALALTLAPGALHAQATPPLRVTTSLGALDGRDSAGVAHWLGIPFAAPPVGALRWKSPMAPVRWSGTRDASAFGPTCVQTDRLAKMYGGAMDPISEDCLTLNVWSASPSGAKKPVMVWIHGGGFTHGSGRATIYDGTRLAQLGAVVVTINYRLGVFGFLSHPALSAESRTKGSGAYGFLDQVAALQWVKREIAAFGGDPDNVTIFGESAGAFSVGYHLVSPMSRGLFHRAIMESGSPYRFTAPVSGPDSMRTGERAGLKLAAKVGVTGRGADAATALRAMPADSLLARLGDAGLDDIPEVVDGEFLVEPPTASLLAGRVAKVPVIIGSNADESTVLVRTLKVKTAADLDSAIRASYPGPFAERALAAYPPSAGAVGPVKAYRLLWTDDVFTATARETARAMTRAGAPVYRYYYTRVAGGMTGLALGAFHASEIPFVFGVRGMTSPLWGQTPYDATLADAMSGAWTRFAAAGDPNGPGLAAWPRFTVNGDEAIEFGATIGAIPGPRPAQLDLLGEVLAFRARTSERATLRAGTGR
jgi:para-nitrobenzyl esterase